MTECGRGGRVPAAFKPCVSRRRRQTAAASTSRGYKVAFTILQAQRGLTPAYDHMLRGVSAACNRFGLHLHVGFVDDPTVAVRQMLEPRHDGLLLHGICPPAPQIALLKSTPTVWLMGNSRRPTWGDQVMPDNALIGRTAASYLLSRGHSQAIYFGMTSGWSMGVRALAFENTLEEAGGRGRIIHQKISGNDKPIEQDIEQGIGEVVSLYRRLDPKPTGLFIAEDWLVRDAYKILTSAGIRPGEELDIISCNNDRPHLLGLTPPPATIDIRFETIAYRGVEQLLNRMRGDRHDDRLRIMVEPKLVEPGPYRSVAWS